MLCQFWPLAASLAFAGVTSANPSQFLHFYENIGAGLRQRDTFESPKAVSPPSYPSPWMNPHAIGWESAYAQAKAFVAQMTLMEKVNLTTGVG